MHPSTFDCIMNDAAFRKLRCSTVRRFRSAFLGGFETLLSEASFRGAGGAVAPPPPKEKEKKRKEKKKRKKKQKEKEKRKKEKKKKGTMNSVKLLHIKCCFFNLSIVQVALKNKKNFGPPKKVEMRPLAVIRKCCWYTCCKFLFAAGSAVSTTLTSILVVAVV